jgi:hypothetical protein
MIQPGTEETPGGKGWIFWFGVPRSMCTRPSSAAQRHGHSDTGRAQANHHPKTNRYHHCDSVTGATQVDKSKHAGTAAVRQADCTLNINPGPSNRSTAVEDDLRLPATATSSPSLTLRSACRQSSAHITWLGTPLRFGAPVSLLKAWLSPAFKGLSRP